ncbi:MFS transporter [Streptomyces olivaceoviridis]|uniref:MFS transporter n=1 Tax=Streptomyces olivaceoviridis TaxID=1921 RepID=UPI003698A280
MRPLLARRDIFLLVLARLIGMAGSNALWIALGIRVKELTNSNSAASLTFFAFILGTLGAPLGGALVDRLRRRPLLIILNLASLVLVLPLLLVHDRHSVWICYVVMTMYGLASSSTSSAMTAITQTMIPPERLGDANGLLQTLLQGTRLIAPLLGAGVLSAFGLGPLVIGDAATFALAALFIALIRPREDRPQPAQQVASAQIAAGFRYIAQTPALRRFTVAVVLAMVTFGLSESVLFAVVDSGLHRSPTFLGVLSSLQGAGALAAGVAAAVLMRRAGEGWTVVLGLACAAIGFFLSAAPSLLAVAPGTVLIGASLPLIVAGVMTFFQRHTPAELMGRTDSALNVLIGVPQTAAIAAGAALITLVDYRVVLALMAILMVIAALYLATRTTGQPPETAVAVPLEQRASEGVPEAPRPSRR